MQITEVSLPVRSVEEWGEFFGGPMGLIVERNGGRTSVRVGTTVIDFRVDEQQVGDHHLAFSIPDAQFDAAKEWLARWARVLSLDGADEFECSPAWNAHSIYFDGPERSVLELIARRDLPHGDPGPFTGSAIVGVSEVGITVTDVPATAAALAHTASVEPYGAAAGDTFAPVGTTEGLLVLVSAGRTWFPTADRTSGASAISIGAEGGTPGTYRIGPSTLSMHA